MVGVVGETGDVVGIRARGGNANPGRAMGSFVDECVGAVPKEVRARYQLWLRVDSVVYGEEVVEAAERHHTVLTITAKKTTGGSGRHRRADSGHQVAADRTFGAPSIEALIVNVGCVLLGAPARDPVISTGSRVIQSPLRSYPVLRAGDTAVHEPCGWVRHGSWALQPGSTAGVRSALGARWPAGLGSWCRAARR